MRVLIAEDDAMSCRLLEHLLVKQGYQVVATRDGAAAWHALQQQDAPKLAILDWMMPEMDGPQICRLIRERAQQPYTYILLLTARAQKQDIIQGLEAGADDYLTKPFEAGELRARVRAGRRILELQEQLIAAREEYRFAASHDSLTGLWNRPAILDALRTELARARREQAPVAIALADLDHFKRINDHYGHAAGDQVLREAARRMRSALRLYDPVGRYGGEEFVIVLPGCDTGGALSQAERLRASIGADPMDTSEGRIPVTLSLGVAVGAPADGADAESLLRAADEALYRAKNAGRNRVELAAEFARKIPTE